MLSEDEIKGKWGQIKGGIRNLWGNITDDDLEATKGNLASIAGIVQKQYGETKESIKEKLTRLMESFENETDRSDFSTDSYQRKPEGQDSHP